MSLNHDRLYKIKYRIHFEDSSEPLLRTCQLVATSKVAARKMFWALRGFEDSFNLQVKSVTIDAVFEYQLIQPELETKEDANKQNIRTNEA